MFHLNRIRLLRCCFSAAGFCLAASTLAPAAAQTPAPHSPGFTLGTGQAPAPLAAPAPPAEEGYQPPKLLERGPVAYPILANLNRIEGTVGIHFAIDETGKVINATVNRTSRSLTLDAVAKSRGMLEWTFQPARLNGKPVPSTYDQAIEFHMDPEEQRAFARQRLAAPIGTPDPAYPAEALAIRPHPRGDVTVGVYWTPAGRVDLINLVKPSGSATLDHAALRFAYLNWRIDPKQIKDAKEQYTQVITFTPPEEAAGKPSPLPAAAQPPATPRPARTH